MIRSARSAYRSWRHARLHRWHAHAGLRPTAVAVLVAAIAGALTFFGLMLDDKALMVSSVALWVLIVVELMVIGVQAWCMRSRFLSNAPENVNIVQPQSTTIGADFQDVARVVALQVQSPWRSMILPRFVSSTQQWESINQRGAVFARVVGPIPPVRGLYRLHSRVATWCDPFGLWKIRSILSDSHEEFTVLPQTQETRPRRLRSLSDIASGEEQTQSFSGVRAYAQGDSPRMIAWKYSAHRGELMTRESNSYIPANVVLLLDPQDEGLEDCVRRALEYCKQGSDIRSSSYVSDGSVVAQPGDDAHRLLACVHPQDDQASGALLQAQDALRALQRIIVLTSSLETSDMERALQHSALSERYEVVHVDSDTRSIDAGSTNTGSTDSVSSDIASKSHMIILPTGDETSAHYGHADAANSNPHNVNSGEDGYLRNARIHAVTVQLMTIAAVWGIFAVTLRALTAVIDIQGWWLWYSVLGLAMLGVEISIPSKNLARSLMRQGIDALAFLLSGIILADLRIYQAHGVWLLQAGETVVETLANGEQHTTTSPSGFSTAWTALTHGFNTMYEQYPPVQINADADALIIVVTSVALIVLRCLMTQMQASPILAVFPIIAMSLSNLVVGDAQTTWALIIVIGAGLTLIWSTNRPLDSMTSMRAHSSTHGRQQFGAWRRYASIAATPAIPTGICAVISAIAIVTAPLSLSLARRVTIGYGQAPGLFSNQTVSPLIDLKRDLQEGSSSTVFTYTADRTMYMRMSTLGNFNGDTWNFNLNTLSNEEYGARNQTSANSGQDSFFSNSSYDGTSPDRLTQLARFASRDFSDADDLSAYLEHSSIHIQSLSSSFLPVPGIGLRFKGAADSATWNTRYDGSLFTADSGSKNGTQYAVNSVYMSPIQNSSDFYHISDLQQAMLQLEKHLQEDIDTASQSPNTQSDNADSSSRTTTDPSTWQLYRSRLSQLTSDDSGTGRRLRQYYGSLAKPLPANAQAIVNQARSEGIATTGANAGQEIAAMRYLVRYFTTNGFTYSLNAPDGNGRGNMQIIGDFLKTKTGYCIHYASALAVLGRAMGLSTRMVLGYNAGTAKRGSHSVTANQLHAWVETYIDGIGWVPFDVTPAAANSESTPSDASSTPSASVSTNTSSSPTPTNNDTTSSLSPSPSASSSSQQTDRQHAQRTGIQVPDYVWQMIALMAGMLLIVSTPTLLRRLQLSRRLSRMSGYAQSGSPLAWIIMWQEIMASAIDAGMHWPNNASDMDIAHVIADALVQHNATLSPRVLSIYERAAAAAYGAHGVSPDFKEQSLKADDHTLQEMKLAIEQSGSPETGAKATIRRCVRRHFPKSLMHVHEL